MNKPRIDQDIVTRSVDQRVGELLGRMTLAEKIGQMNQVHSDGAGVDHLRGSIQSGRIGSVINEVDVETVNELQRIAVEESRLGIPLLIGRDVIHGFKTVMPIPLGQAATWNPEIVREAARAAACEAAASGVNWTFAPMIDISRDPRWGRIAESFGEDAHLTSALGAAMIRGFQGDKLTGRDSIAACAKHFAGYGACESGRDYAATNIPENELRNVYLPPFKAAVDAGVCSVMTSFSDLDGVPATANEFLLQQVLRDEWDFDGLVVSDWDSVRQLAIHGLTENDKASALAAVTAGVDMEMVGESYLHHLAELINEGRVDESMIDAMVSRILRVKVSLGLFEHPYTDPSTLPAIANADVMETARKAALQSVVLLKNDQQVLPLSSQQLKSLAIIGPLADAPYEQLGTWVFDGDERLSVTPLRAICDLIGESVNVRYVRAMKTSRSRASDEFDEAQQIALESDATILFLGEESILSGEAHCRADIDLPGDQADLVRHVAVPGKPVIAVIMAGRPLTLTNVLDHLDAILYAWHPGTMGGAAIADLLFGVESPSGKLPVTFPKMVGQIPIYYNQKNTGKPPSPETTVNIDSIDARAPQTSFGMTAFHLDAGYEPLFVFGHGLSYAEFEYRKLQLESPQIQLGDTLRVSAELTNRGEVAADEVVQCYIRDLIGSVTRPVKELKDFRRVRLVPGETREVTFELPTDKLAFHGRGGGSVVEPGAFHVWVGGTSETELRGEFRVISPTDEA